MLCARDVEWKDTITVLATLTDEELNVIRCEQMYEHRMQTLSPFCLTCVHFYKKFVHLSDNLICNNYITQKRNYRE